MRDGPDIARVAALIGDPARANVVAILLDGRAHTPGELARHVGVSAQTMSGHLARLCDGGITIVRKQGRHRYVTLAYDEVADALEMLSGLAAASGHLRSRPGPRDAALRRARVCYKHLAGERGVQLYDSLVAREAIRLAADGLDLTAGGEALMRDLGVDVATLRNGWAPLCRPCLDWSERRSHLGGSLGRALLARMETLGWVRREEGSRAVRFTAMGERAFDAAFGPVA